MIQDAQLFPFRSVSRFYFIIENNLNVAGANFVYDKTTIFSFLIFCIFCFFSSVELGMWIFSKCVAVADLVIAHFHSMLKEWKIFDDDRKKLVSKTISVGAGGIQVEIRNVRNERINGYWKPIFNAQHLNIKFSIFSTYIFLVISMSKKMLLWAR